MTCVHPMGQGVTALLQMVVQKLGPRIFDLWSECQFSLLWSVQCGIAVHYSNGDQFHLQIDVVLTNVVQALRNSVPVPRHWSQKRKYLQGKRGIEKPPFVLPEYIEATGIGDMRAAYQEKEESKKLKQKQRERMQPKLGKMDIDYTVSG